MPAEFNAFAEGSLSEYLADRRQLVSETIKNESDEYVVNVSPAEYRQHLAERFVIAPPVLLVQDLSMDKHERMIPAERFPFNFNVYEGKSYPRPVYIIHIPVSGESQLIRYQPSTRLMWSYPVLLLDNELTFEVLTFTEDAARIRSEIDSITNNLTTQSGHLTAEVNDFNVGLPTEVNKTFEYRKSQILKERSIVESIGIPLRKASDAPQTFSVPSPAVPKKIAPKPPLTSHSGEPEPTLAKDDYAEILSVVHDLGVSLERHPSTYEGKGEEDLRDYLLLLLQPRFEGSATGETFNKSGKTDILLRYKNQNVFIAECKFWSGIKGLFKAITQLLGYLTWRDSKAALVLFVRNQQFSQVLSRIEEEIGTHPQFARQTHRPGESWIEYRFFLPEDETREVTLTVLAFHLP